MNAFLQKEEDKTSPGPTLLLTACNCSLVKYLKSHRTLEKTAKAPLEITLPNPLLKAGPTSKIH